MSSDPVGLIVSTFAFVSHLYCAGTTLYVLAKQRTQNRQQLNHRNRHIFIVATLKLLGTVNFIAFANGSTNDYPSATSAWVQDSAAFITSLLAQSYLIHRCHILFGRRRIVLCGLLSTLFLVIGFGAANLAFLGDSRFPDPTFHLRPDYAFVATLPLIYWLLALSFNVGLNALIILRLLKMRSRVRMALGQEYSQMYTGIAAMILESSLLYTIVLVIAYWALPEGGTYNLFSPIIAQTEAIASELIILRFALGRSLSKSTIRVATTIKPDMEAQLGPGALEKSHALAHTPPSTPSTQFTQIYPSSVAAVLRSHHQPEPVVRLNRMIEWQKAGSDSGSELER